MCREWGEKPSHVGCADPSDSMVENEIGRQIFPVILLYSLILDEESVLPKILAN